MTKKKHSNQCTTLYEKKKTDLFTKKTKRSFAPEGCLADCWVFLPFSTNETLVSITELLLAWDVAGRQTFSLLLSL
jgi:hypothetical protein